MLKALIMAGSTAVLTAACAAVPAQPDDDVAAIADPRLGAEVDSICFAGTINGWRTVEGDDEAVILTKGVSDDFRVAVSGPCSASDFRFAQTIGIESRPGGGCVTRGDVLLVESAGDFVNRCFITRINRWDEDALLEGEAGEM